MCQPQKIEPRVLQPLQIAILLVVRHRIPDPRMILVPVRAANGQRLAVDHKAQLVVVRQRADAEPRHHRVRHFATAPHFRLQCVEPRMIRMPELRLRHRQPAIRRHLVPRRQRRQRRLRLGHRPARRRHHREPHGPIRRAAALVQNIRLCEHRRTVRRGRLRPHKNPAARHAVRRHRIGDVQRVRHHQLHIPVQTAEIREVQLVVPFPRRDQRLVRIVQPYRHHRTARDCQRVREIHRERQITALMRHREPPVHPHLRHLHRPLEPQRYLLSTPRRVRCNHPPIPAHTLKIMLRLRRILHARRVRQHHPFPRRVIKRDRPLPWSRAEPRRRRRIGQRPVQPLKPPAVIQTGFPVLAGVRTGQRTSHECKRAKKSKVVFHWFHISSTTCVRGITTSSVGGCFPSRFATSARGISQTRTSPANVIMAFSQINWFMFLCRIPS